MLQRQEMVVVSLKVPERNPAVPLTSDDGLPIWPKCRSRGKRILNRMLNFPSIETPDLQPTMSACHEALPIRADLEYHDFRRTRRKLHDALCVDRVPQRHP